MRLRERVNKVGRFQANFRSARMSGCDLLHKFYPQCHYYVYLSTLTISTHQTYVLSLIEMRGSTCLGVDC